MPRTPNMMTYFMEYRALFEEARRKPAVPLDYFTESAYDAAAAKGGILSEKDWADLAAPYLLERGIKYRGYHMGSVWFIFIDDARGRYAESFSLLEALEFARRLQPLVWHGPVVRPPPRRDSFESAKLTAGEFNEP